LRHVLQEEVCENPLMDFWTVQPQPSAGGQTSALAGWWHRVLSTHTATVTCVAAHPTRPNVYVSAGLQGEVIFWHASKRMQLGPSYWPRAPATAVAFSSCGSHVAFGLQSGALEVCGQQRTRLWHLRVCTDTIRDVKFSPDGRWLAAASEDTSVVLLRCRPSSQVFQVAAHCRGHAAAVLSLDFSADSCVLRSTCSACEVRHWPPCTRAIVPSSTLTTAPPDTPNVVPVLPLVYADKCSFTACRYAHSAGSEHCAVQQAAVHVAGGRLQSVVGAAESG
jgi:WD40 repeat protein